jgi:exopolysaccharide biosynthesis polyprenyl glycosylphosphotransferase
MTNKNNTNNQTSFVRFRPRQRINLLIFGDLISSGIALIAALFLWSLHDDWLSFSYEFIAARTPTWFFFLPLLWIFMLLELYDIRRSTSMQDTIRAILFAALLCFTAYLFIYFAAEPSIQLPRRAIAYFIPLATALTLLWRRLYIAIFTNGPFVRRILILGAGDAGKLIMKELLQQPAKSMELVGFVDDNPELQNIDIDGYKVLGDRTDLMKIVSRYLVTDVICAISKDIHPELVQILIKLEENGYEVSTMSQIYEEITGKIPAQLMDSEWLIKTFYSEAHSSASYALSKRFIDLVAGLVGTFFYITLLPILALLIFIESGAPIFIRQTRVGKNGKPYTMIKFRTMSKKSQDAGNDLTLTAINDPRITKAGKLLRKSHLDELPQFWIILKGEMSLVGPRAEINSIAEQFEKDIPFYRARFMSKPGLTGWAQIHQNYAATTEETAEKLRYDLYYIKHRSLILDLQIIVRTVSNVLGLKGR